MTDTTREPKRMDQRALDRLEASRRLIVLATVAMFGRGGASVSGLAKGLNIMPRGAIVASLKALESSGLIFSRLEPSKTVEGIEMRRYYPDDDLELNFTI